MKKTLSFIFLLTAFVLSLSFASRADAASTSVNIKPYGVVYVTANHYSNTGQWDAEGTNNLMRNPAGAAMGAINNGGSYSYTYSCGNQDIVSVSCAGGNTCYQSNVYSVTGSCGLALKTECANGCGQGQCSPPTPGSPDRPVIQVSTSDVCGGKVRITWAASAGATSYSIYRSTTQDGVYKEVPNSPTTLTDFTDAPGTDTYFYKVKAINAAGTSLSTSASAKGSKYCPPLPASGDITGGPAAQCGGKVAVTWAPVPGAAGYNVYRWTADNTATYNSYLSSYRSNGRSANDFPYYFKYYGYNVGLQTPTGVESGTAYTDTVPGKGPYYYAVAAYPSAGANKSDMGRFVAATKVTDFSDKCAPPVTPANFSVKTASACGGKTYMTWNKSAGADSYIISRSTSASGSYNNVATVDGNANYFTDTPGDGTYFYKVAASSGGSVSDPSAALQATASDQCKDGDTGEPVPVTLSIKAVPSYVVKGKTCDIQVTVADADTCTITGSNGDASTFDPSKVTKFTSSPLQSRTIYTVTCQNDKASSTKSTACNINPTVNEN